MATAREYLETAAQYIGVSGTDNIFNTWYYGYPVYDPDYYPWCATYQSYIGIHALHMAFQASASASGVAWQGQEISQWDVQPGDWVLFNWNGRPDFGWADHIGVVEWTDIRDSGYFGTIEGNTGWAYGGEVARQTRSIYNGYSVKFFRPPYEEDDMAAQDVWNHPIQGPNVTLSAGQRLVDIEAYLHDEEDPTGRGVKGDMKFRIAWMAKKQEDQQKQLDRIEALLKKIASGEKAEDPEPPAAADGE